MLPRVPQVTAEHQLRYAEAFRREIFILRSCHDRNIVQFIGACLQVRACHVTAMLFDGVWLPERGLLQRGASMHDCVFPTGCSRRRRFWSI